MQENIFDPEAYQSVKDRINQLSADTQPQWGKMSVGQMLAHCSGVQDNMNGIKMTKGNNFITRLFAPMIKKMVIKGEYKKNSRTHPALVQTESKEFEAEKQRLLQNTEAFVQAGEEKAAATPHDLFGKMTAAEKGRAIYKHLDHHLKQFGV